MGPQKPLIRPPTSLTTFAPTPVFQPPPLLFLAHTWHITHSTLPMWKSERNVSITYKPLPSPSSSLKDSLTHLTPSIAAKLADIKSPSASPPTDLPQLDDLVQSQPLGSDKVKEVHGIDTASGAETGTGSWEWRGRGALMVVGSHWEVLGWGPTESEEGEQGEEGDIWLVIYFAKTLFTPVGMDILSRKKEGLGKETMEGILEGLRGVEDEGFGGLVGELFEVRRD